MRFVRAYSVKSLPFEAKPVNKFNPVKSAYNFRPKTPTNGLVYAPPASLTSVKQTPNAFLPQSDPRKNLGVQKTYTEGEVNDMPVIYGTTKSYHVSQETALEILNLRTSDPSQWTISKLCKKYNVNPHFIINLTKDFKPKAREAENPQLSKRQLDQKKRVQMWLRNEF
ncbi:hypothetical protein PSN45_005131 [Yamadazyma tenuis]|uniref:Uncharacterized protein n=1 Tax=Candida tenuis (strain ATCC 10573 / BCRC 21748 / CBS 615 / JCM 9827 / NBRC 10315 / NRRL Y-1498 / VKM Y-70) TaxID=590646 RepID=G3B2W9_CANTC|nr:uncharacterized protein CANTEDRAFT_113556 [Yamadazyma tenuis ATCC 10573]XP_006685936.1 uncharacterized protein CANTEDRAFT_113556 [Yamadazyma tenuis ATCC 10573]EGV65129.1 hypothetical protein CANTEDRAFT_113556 [Yamadazyma tenuis ATCC 10573]EGV65130.1 hypothetical protein CANTEDRAFT_113556 [Yamadazyma tenuis ATCC 10573]WEJ97575.1 hypothetical protein PSN45_005131 [Yamadazyma tenuis]